MKIIKRNSDNVVLFTADSLQLNEGGAISDKMRTKTVNSSNATLETVDSLPDDFINGGWTYINGVWATNAIGDTHIAGKLEEQAEQSRLDEIDADITQDTLINQLSVMTKTELNAWWSANVTSMVEANNILKQLVFREIRRRRRS